MSDDGLGGGARGGAAMGRPLLTRSYTRTDTYIQEKFQKTQSMIERERRGTVLNSIFTLVSTIVGGGSLSLPYAFACTGLVLGQGLLLAFSLITAYAIQLLVVSSRFTGGTSYQDVGVKTFGPWMGGLVVSMIFCVCMCGCVGYCVLMGDLIPSIAPAIFNGTEFVLGTTGMPGSKTGYNRLCYMALAMLLIFPVTLLRKMTALKFTSIISVVAMFVLGGIIVFRDIEPVGGQYLPRGDIAFATKFDTQFMLAFPILACSFLCHFNVLPVYSDIIRPSKNRMNMVIFGTCIGVMLLYQAIATFGYLTFHQLLISMPEGGDILNMYPAGDIAVTIGSIGLIITVVLSYPLIVHPARATLLYIWFRFIRLPPADGVLVVGEAAAAGGGGGGANNLSAGSSLSAGDSLQGGDSLDAEQGGHAMAEAGFPGKDPLDDSVGGRDDGNGNRNGNAGTPVRSGARAGARRGLFPTTYGTNRGGSSEGTTQEGSDGDGSTDGNADNNGSNDEAAYMLRSPVSADAEGDEAGYGMDTEQRVAAAVESLSCGANFVFTLVHMLVVLGIGYACPSVVTVWTLCGATCGVVVSFILPPLFYLRVTQLEDDTRCICGTKCTAKRCPAFGLFFLGVVAFLACTTITIYCDINPITQPNSTGPVAGNGTTNAASGDYAGDFAAAAAADPNGPGMSYPTHGPFTFLY